MQRDTPATPSRFPENVSKDDSESLDEAKYQSNDQGMT
jgi:hypothetical protein